MSRIRRGSRDLVQQDQRPRILETRDHPNREDVRRRYEPHCASTAGRVRAIRQLRQAGLDVSATLAPVLPCDPEELAAIAIDATARDVIADPFHSRDNRPHGAITREAACRISAHWGLDAWHEPAFQRSAIERIRTVVEAAGRRLGVGTEGFRWLAECDVERGARRHVRCSAPV